MANWKKMAEAFGRAVHNRERLTDHAPLSNKGRMKAERNDAIEDKRWERMADKAGAGEEFRRGFNDEELLPDYGATVRDNDADEFVPAKEFASTQRNQIELDDAITAALDKRYGGDERAKAQARRDVINDLQNGTEVSDILDRLDRSRMGREWDDAFDKAKARIKRDYGPDYPENMAEEGAQTFEDQLWDVIDELKSRGRSVEDILGALKSMGEK